MSLLHVSGHLKLSSSCHWHCLHWSMKFIKLLARSERKLNRSLTRELVPNSSLAIATRLQLVQDPPTSQRQRLPGLNFIADHRLTLGKLGKLGQVQAAGFLISMRPHADPPKA